MRGDDESDRLAGDDLFDLINHGCRACLAIGRIDQNDVIFHFDGKAVMRSADDPPDAVSHALRLGDYRAS